LKILLSHIISVWAGTKFSGITCEDDGSYIEIIEPEKKLIRRNYRIIVTKPDSIDGIKNEWKYLGSIRVNSVSYKYWACDLIPLGKNSLQKITTNVNLVT
jgi:hypothetical protein